MAEVPSNVRHWVVFYSVTLAVLAYMDRVTISQAAGPISADLHLSKGQMGLIFSAFGLAYALFEMPSGVLGDLFGPRKVLVRVVLWWSGATAATGAAWSFGSLWIIRFLFGAGEAGCFPNITKAFSVWLPASERSRAQGLLWAFARWGGAFTPPLVVLAFHYVSWRWAFVAFGAIGLVWSFFFNRWFRDRPEDHPGVNAAELDLLRDVSRLAAHSDRLPWRKLTSNLSVWLLAAQYFCLIFSWIFYITWLPTYLQEYHHQSQAAAARLAVIPLLCGGIGSLLCGVVAPRLSRRMGSVSRARRTLSTAGLVGAAALLVIATRIADPFWATMTMGLASFSNDFDTPPSWNAAMDIGGRYAGSVAGAMSTAGHIAAIVAPSVGGFLLDWTHGNWNLFIYIMAGVFALGAVCWQFIDSATPVNISV